MSLKAPHREPTSDWIRPVVYDLFCGLGGWSEGFMAEGYECIGFDVEAHRYPKRVFAESSEKLPSCGANVPGIGWTGFAKTNGVSWRNRHEAGIETDEWEEYPGTLIIRDVRSIHGSELKDAAVIVASPPCQAYSYRAMPWKRAKALPPPDNTLFNECFRIQREASEAAGHYIPLIVENVRGAQPWVGRARWNYGSFYLWGDVPALMPLTAPKKLSGRSLNAGEGKWRPANGLGLEESDQIDGQKAGHPERSYRNGHVSTAHLTNRSEHGVKQGGSGAAWFDKALDERRKEATAIENGGDWFSSGENCSLQRRQSSKSTSRKAASAMIAKIPFPLSQHIARCYKVSQAEAGAKGNGWTD